MRMRLVQKGFVIHSRDDDLTIQNIKPDPDSPVRWRVVATRGTVANVLKS